MQITGTNWTVELSNYSPHFAFFFQWSDIFHYLTNIWHSFAPWFTPCQSAILTFRWRVIKFPGATKQKHDCLEQRRWSKDMIYCTHFIKYHVLFPLEWLIHFSDEIFAICSTMTIFSLSRWAWITLCITQE